MSTGPRRLGKYELQEPLGRGGMGQVWKAFDPQLQRYVAIKLLLADLQSDPDFVARFKREAQFIASLHHPNIVQIYDFHFAADSPASDSSIAYMVMDYVEGQTLAGYIHNTSHQRQFPPAVDIVNLFTSISMAIDYAHQKGMVHRDIKPANILLDKRFPGRRNPMGEPILTDFGIARLLGATTVTFSRFGSGTPLYFSPEQARGQRGDRRSDLYSLGVILYEMLTGITPFRGDNLYTIMVQHCSDAPPPPASINPTIPPAVSAVILRSLAKDRDARFPSASAMTIALAQALNVPVPAELHQPFTPTGPLNTPTSANPQQPSLPAGMAPSPVSFLPSPAALSSLPFTPSPDSGQTTPMAPGDSISGAKQNLPIVAQAASQHHSILAPTGDETLVLTPPQQPRGAGRRRGLLIALMTLIVIVLVGSGLGTFLLLGHKSSTTLTASAPVVGHVFFASSGNISQNGPQGIVDELTIDLHNIPPPPAGKSYYAWLLGDSNDSEEAQPILLGKISVDHGTIHYPYSSDQQHDNLLANTSRFLITAEDATISPIFPSTDSSAQLYHATIPQTPSASDHYSLLDHLRHLLAEDPKLKRLGLHGGLDIWLLRNTKQLSQWASDARQNQAMIRQSIVDILYYLDGQACVQSDLQGVPQETPKAPENGTITNTARVALLQLCGQLPAPGYLVHIGVHLNGIIHAPGATADQMKLVNQVTTEIDHLHLLLEKMHHDAQQLVKMTDAQLSQPAAQLLLHDLATSADAAYNSQSTNPGAQQINDDIQRLTTLDVTPCPSSTTAKPCV